MEMPIRTEIQLEAEAAAGISSNELVAGGTLVVLVEVSPSGNYGATSLLRPDNRQQLPQNFLSATKHRHKDIILCANISTQPTNPKSTFLKKKTVLLSNLRQVLILVLLQYYQFSC